MKDSNGAQVSADSLKAYRAFMNPPSRVPYLVFAVVIVASVCGTLAYLGTLASNAYQAKACLEAEGTWTPSKGCVAPTIEVNHYNVVLPPRGQGGDVPTPPPVIPDNPGPKL